MREDDRDRIFNYALPRVEINRNFAAGYLIFAGMNYWTAGKHYDALGLVKERVIAGLVVLALADTNIAVGVHLLHVVEILSEHHPQRVAGKLAPGLLCVNAT